MVEVIEAESRNVNLTPDERNWGMFCHLAVFAGCIIPFGSLIGPLVIWLMKKDQYAFVDYHGKEVLNFQITVLIAALIGFALMFVLIGFLLLPILVVIVFVLTIIGVIKAANGEYYRYPWRLQFIK